MFLYMFEVYNWYIGFQYIKWNYFIFPIGRLIIIAFTLKRSNYENLYIKKKIEKYKKYEILMA